MAVPILATPDLSKVGTDPLAISLIGCTVSSCFWLACTQIILCTPTPLSVAVGVINVACLSAYVWDHRKEIFYEVSLICSVARSFFFPEIYPWWNKMDDRLYLGAIPRHDADHLQGIYQLGNSLAILSLLEDFELEDKYVFTKPICHHAWQQKGIDTLQLHAVDCVAVEQDVIDRGVAFIRQKHEEGKTVYVHCKAGIGRSATVLACYLLKHGRADGTKFHSVKDVVQYILGIRDHVIIDRGHARIAIEQFFQRLHP